MSERFEIRVEGVRFAAGHFATYAGRCEPIHGHSYEVAARVEGLLTEDAWIIDFRELRAALRQVCRELDHRFLLQRDSSIITISETATSWELKTPGGDLYILPRQDVFALPIDNTTSERLAEWLSNQLWQALAARGMRNILALTVEVWEGPGQRASYRREHASLDRPD